eukprot:jgi/Psemu1/15189/gm1.15189_g
MTTLDTSVQDEIRALMDENKLLVATAMKESSSRTELTEPEKETTTATALPAENEKPTRPRLQDILGRTSSKRSQKRLSKGSLTKHTQKQPSRSYLVRASKLVTKTLRRKSREDPNSNSNSTIPPSLTLAPTFDNDDSQSEGEDGHGKHPSTSAAATATATGMEIRYDEHKHKVLVDGTESSPSLAGEESHYEHDEDQPSSDLEEPDDNDNDAKLRSVELEESNDDSEAPCLPVDLEDCDETVEELPSIALEETSDDNEVCPHVDLEECDNNVEVLPPVDLVESNKKDKEQFPTADAEEPNDGVEELPPVDSEESEDNEEQLLSVLESEELLQDHVDEPISSNDTEELDDENQDDEDPPSRDTNLPEDDKKPDLPPEEELNDAKVGDERPVPSIDSEHKIVQDRDELLRETTEPTSMVAAAAVDADATEHVASASSDSSRPVPRPLSPADPETNDKAIPSKHKDKGALFLLLLVSFLACLVAGIGFVGFYDEHASNKQPAVVSSGPDTVSVAAKADHDANVPRNDAHALSEHEPPPSRPDRKQQQRDEHWDEMLSTLW